MKLILATLLALAITSEATYTLPNLVVPAVTYGVPEESKPVVPAVVYGVPEQSKLEVAPIKTEYAYTIPAVSTVKAHHEEVIVHPAPSEIHVPSGVTTLVDGYTVPHTYTSGYVPSVPAPYIYSPQAISAPSLGYSSVYSYGYSVPHASYPHLVYSGEPLVSSVPSSQVTITGPSQISTVITGSHDAFEDNHQKYEYVSQEPVVTKYEYEIPHVVVPEVVKPGVPHTTYGLPHVEVRRPVIPHTTYGLPY